MKRGMALQLNLTVFPTSTICMRGSVMEMVMGSSLPGFGPGTGGGRYSPTTTNTGQQKLLIRWVMNTHMNKMLFILLKKSKPT